MAIELSQNELRVLGVLIEKSMATPEYYPMTINSIVAACNQKNNRDPVMKLTDGEVSAAVHGLSQWQLVGQAPPEPGARANRFLHHVEKRFNWNASMRAVMCELMIRGPQTIGELRTNASRLTHLEASDYVREIVGELEHCDPPMVKELPRQVGQSAVRYAHLLGGPISDSTPAVPIMPAPTKPLPPSVSAPPSPGLAERVAILEREVAGLRSELETLKRKESYEP